MGVFLVIALFFNNISLLNFSDSSNVLSNFSFSTECENIKPEQNCIGYISSSENSASPISNYSNFSLRANCEKQFSQINCTSNSSLYNHLNLQTNQNNNNNYAKFFSFLSTVLFFIISCVVVIDAFRYIRIYRHSKSENAKRANVEMLKDLTIFIFIIPFVYLLIFFATLIANTYGEFFAAGFLIFSITIYTAEIIFVMYLLFRFLYSLNGNRKKEQWFSAACLFLGIGVWILILFAFPMTINFASPISMALILMSIISFIRPYIEKKNPEI